MKKILITRNLPQLIIDNLSAYKELELDVRSGGPMSAGELAAAIREKDAVITCVPDKIDADVLRAAGAKLKLVAQYAVGYDNIDLETATKMGVYVSNTPGNLSESIAEHALGLMFAVGRKIAVADSFMRSNGYHFFDPLIYMGQKFGGKTIGVVGLGATGAHFAKICKNGLGMKVIYTDVDRNIEIEKELKAQFATLDDLLENSDIVLLSCPLNEKTHHLIGEKELRKMKPTAILLNTARGAVVNEELLIQALKENWIEGAGLDVFENESDINPEFFTLENVVLTPHIASATKEARIQMAKMVVDNVLDVLVRNQPPTNLINKELLKSQETAVTGSEN